MAHHAKWAAEHPGRENNAFPIAVYGDEATYSATYNDKFTALTLQSPLLQRRKGHLVSFNVIVIRLERSMVACFFFKTPVNGFWNAFGAASQLQKKGSAFNKTFLFFIVSSAEAVGTGAIETLWHYE